MKITRKLASLTALSAAAALALSGCSQGTPEVTSSSSGAAASETTVTETAEISFLTFTSPSLTKEFWEGQVANFESANPDVKVEILYTPDLDRHGYAKQLLSSGQLPDVLWDAPLTDFVEAGALLPFPDSAFEALSVPDNFGAIDGKRYHLSTGVFVMNGIYYNPDAFAAAGVEVPQTFAELKAAAAKLSAAGYVPMLLQSSSDSWANSYLLDGFVDSDVLANTPDWLGKRKAGEVSFSDADFRSAVQKFVDLRDAKAFNADALSLNYSQAVSEWATGKYAMWPMGGWGAGVPTTGFTSATMLTPGNNSVLAVSPGPSLYVSASTKYPEAAQRFAVFMSLSKEYAEGAIVADGVLPVMKDPIAAPEGTSNASKQALEFVANSSDYTVVWPFPVTASGDDAPPSGWGGEYNKAIEGLLSGWTVDKFVATLDDKWDSLNN